MKNPEIEEALNYTWPMNPGVKPPTDERQERALWLIADELCSIRKIMEDRLELDRAVLHAKIQEGHMFDEIVEPVLRKNDDPNIPPMA